MKAYMNFYFGATVNAVKVTAKVINYMVSKYQENKKAQAELQFINTLINIQTVPYAQNYKLANGIVEYNLY